MKRQVSDLKRPVAAICHAAASFSGPAAAGAFPECVPPASAIVAK